ncbi:internal virion protein [Western grey kangaroopox virus]|uniref:Internal virion protein n=1 Tax=Western grey kangaroopox virus TaxID=1566307 RepID=A0A2C9DSM4_9POXV|nr:internal virion protein [Western grey kangaroopox virus]ATI21007.1 internal virion protein [Western grey kangaroopox virus]
MNKNNAVSEGQKHVSFLDTRLGCYESERESFSCYIGKYFNLTKQVCEEEANCWVELSSLVRSGRALGFPMVYGVRGHTYGRTVYFEYFKDAKQRRFDPNDRCTPRSVLLQIVLALYSLYKRGIFSDRFLFDMITVPRTTVTISVNQLVMTVSVDSLVVLSIGTQLYRAELPQACYLEYLSSHRELMALRNFHDTEYFFEWIMRNHLEFLSKQYVDIFRVKKKYISTAQLNRMAEPGTLVYLSAEDTILLGITLTDVSINDHVRVIFSQDGGSVFEIDDFSLSDLFVAGELLTRARTASVNM